MANETQNALDSATSSGLSSRLRVSLVALQTQARSQWADLPDQLRASLERLRTRLRDALDLPSKDDLTELIARIDDLDAKITALEARKAELAAEAPSPAAAPADASPGPSGKNGAGPAPAATTRKKSSGRKAGKPKQ